MKKFLMLNSFLNQRLDPDRIAQNVRASIFLQIFSVTPWIRILRFIRICNFKVLYILQNLQPFRDTSIHVILRYTTTEYIKIHPLLTLYDHNNKANIFPRQMQG